MSGVNELHCEILEEMFKYYYFEFEIESISKNEFKFQIKSLWNKCENNRVHIVMRDEDESKLIFTETRSGGSIYLGRYNPNRSKWNRFIWSENFWEEMFLKHLK